jgi:hypothetical protein
LDTSQDWEHFETHDLNGTKLYIYLHKQTGFLLNIYIGIDSGKMSAEASEFAQ